MNSPSDITGFAPEVENATSTAVPVPPARTFYWSVRRELWENRSLYIAPLVVQSVFVFGFFISLFSLPGRMGAAMSMSPAQLRAVISAPFNVPSALMIFTTMLVGAFYCLDTLHGERRDRSILFWKSLPVSDRTTVLAKAAIPLVVLPLQAFVLAVVAHVLIIAGSSIALAGSPRALAAFWSHLRLFQFEIAFASGVAGITLWYTPIYAWLLLVSAWARRAVILWAVLPFLMIAVLERIAFGSTAFLGLVKYRLGGWFQQLYVFPPEGTTRAVDPLAHLTPLKFLTTPGLWLGLLVAAGFLAAAIRLRRLREPI